MVTSDQEQGAGGKRREARGESIKVFKNESLKINEGVKQLSNIYMPKRRKTWHR
jgi:hypothetical protein